jgi:hypothetical protein
VSLRLGQEVQKVLRRVGFPGNRYSVFNGLDAASADALHPGWSPR